MCLFFSCYIGLYLREDILETDALKHFIRTCLLTRICLIPKLKHNEKPGVFKVFTGTNMLI